MICSMTTRSKQKRLTLVIFAFLFLFSLMSLALASCDSGQAPDYLKEAERGEARVKAFRYVEPASVCYVKKEINKAV